MTRYWKCQVVGWSVMGLMGMVIPWLYAGRPRWVFVGRGLAGAALGIALTHGLRRVMHRRAWLGLPPARLFPRLALASVLIAALMVGGVLPFLLAIIRMPKTGPLAVVFASHVAVILVWSTLYAGLHSLHARRVAESARRRLEMNPHFLFNSLNSLRGLVVEDPARAQDAITGLAGLLRHTLEMSRTETTTLGRELQATRRYLELEALRYESRLRYQIDADEASLGHRVPPLLVQTLVENAIRHGIARRPQGGALRIEARLRSEDLLVSVTNTGRLGPAGEPDGVGLANSHERLRLAFGDRVRLVLRQATPDEVTCEVVVPAGAPVAAEGEMPPP